MMPRFFGGERQASAEELEQQEQQELRSRVQLVSSRRRQSSDDDVDSHRSSTLSHISYLSTPALAGGGWSTPAAGVSLAKAPSYRQQFHDDRYSLPTLESFRSVSNGSVDPADRVLEDSSRHRAARKKSRRKQAASQPISVVTREIPSEDHAADKADPDAVYFAPNSPPQSVVSNAVIEKSGAGSTTSFADRMGGGTVLTEVGEAEYALPPLYGPPVSSVGSKKRRRKLTKGAVDDEDDEHFEGGIGGASVGYFAGVAPHVTLEESQKYTFALVLKNTDQIFTLLKNRFPSKSSASIKRDLTSSVSRLQQKCLRRLVQAGLGVVVLDSELPYQVASHRQSTVDEDIEQATKNICILIDPKKNKDLLLHEFKREMDELSIKRGDSIASLGEESLDSIKELCFSPALELQLTHNIIQNAFRDYDKEEWVIDVNKELTVNDVVLECFPLHDRAFNRKFFDEYRKRTIVFNVRNAATGNINRWAVEELRLHFGERVAFLFAFMHIYTKHLVPLTVVCVLYYLSFRFLTAPVWKQYLEGLAVIGFGVACFWAPSFLLCWERETRILVEKWNLGKYKNTVYESNDYNPDFQYNWVKNQLTKEMEKVPKQRKNHWIQSTMLLFVVICAIIQCVCLVPFIQWYVYAKNAPTCTSCYAEEENTYHCVWFMTCFSSETSTIGTDRWVYILIQGILLGLLIDIIFFELFNWMSEKFVRWENYSKKSDHENRLIHRRFVFVWSNWFFWFLFIAFVYMPFGDRILKLFKKVGLGALAPYDWDASLLTLDTLFVTPLVVTQFLNMLLETFVPYLVRKLRGRPSTGCRQKSPFAWCGRALARRYRAAKKSTGMDTDELPIARRETKNLSPKRLAQLVQRQSGFRVDVLPVSDDSNQYSAFEIIAESKLPVFDPVLDYLDALIQFSYVIMFTVVWPLLPFPAFFNNLLEVRGDAFRLLFANRRPMPRRDTSIGEWATVLSYANIIAVTVVMGFIVVYHWGYFITSCNFEFDDGYMVPFASINRTATSDPQTCHNESTTPHWKMVQIVLFVVLEHIGFCFRYLVLQVEKTPAVIRNSGYQRLKQIQQLTASRAAPASQFEYIEQLREMFDKHDVAQDGHLREPELIAFLAEWLCKHPSEIMPYSGIIFRYMDKNRLGKVPFATCCLMMQHVNHDRFFSCLLGLYDPMHGLLNDEIRKTEDGLQLRRVMSEVSSAVSEQRASAASRMSGASMSSALDENGNRLRDSSFFYVNSMQDSKSKSSPVPRGGSNRLLLLASLAGAAFFHLALTIEPLELAVLFPDTSQVIMFQSRRGYTDALQWLESLHSRDELLVLDSILHSPTINSGTPNASNVAGRVARAVASDLPMLVAKVLLQWSLTLYVLRQRALSRPQAVTALVLCAVALVTVKTAHSHVSELLLPGHWRSMTAQQLDSSAQTLSVRFLIRHGASAIVNGMLARAYQLHLSGPLPPIRAQWRKIPRYIGSKNLVISTLFFTAAVAAVMAISAPEFRSLSEASIAIERFALAAALLHLVLIHLSPPGNS